MKYFLLVFVFLGSAVAVCAQKDFYTRQWSDVYKYEIKALPQSALKVVDSIYARAKRDKNTTQLTKALLYQSKFALDLQEDAERVIVKKWKKEIAGNKGPIKNILESVLASIYWEYFKANRWKYYGRTNTEEKVNEEDFRTWSMTTMFHEIHQHFQNSLADRADIGKIPLESIDELLAQADNSKRYRPTLYDFLAHNALDFYSTGESDITRASNRFIINDEDYFFSFENIPLEDADSVSPQLQALKIFRDLMSFHQRRADTSAFLNLEIERLDFLVAQGNFRDAPTLHKNALTTLIRQYRRHPASALLDFEMATLRSGEDSGKKEALIICDQAISRFPDSDGARKCKILRESILLKKLNITAEEYVPVNKPSRLLIGYTNVDSLYFSAFRITSGFEKRFVRSMNDSARQAELSGLTPREKWSVPLKNLEDFQSHSTEVIVPALPQGLFLIVASDKTNTDESIFAYEFIQVTDLVLVERRSGSAYRYQVVDRNNGEPVENAKVHFRTVYNNKDTEGLDEHFATGKDGFFEFKKKGHYSNVTATVTYQENSAVFEGYYFYQRDAVGNEDDESATAKSFLFTDRSIYRPGQTVYFKGILIKTKNKKSTVVPGQYVEVFLEDVNGTEVGTQRLKTNSFGAFSGEFRLPASGLTGEYSLYADEDVEDDSEFYDDLDDFEYDELSISVEEYKRPAFEASFMPVRETFRLNDTITVRGSALAYSGSKVSKAKVSYRVQRKVRYPRWYYWDYSDYSEGEEIAQGETLTNDRGEFKIDFNAIPDEKVLPDNKPIFHYEVTVDVTDINGETRSATAEIKAGYHTLLATINAPAQIDLNAPENTISITTENLNGQFVPAKGKIELYKLQAPSSPVRERPWPASEVKTISEEDFKKLFPNDSYEDTSDPKQWSKGKLVRALEFDTRRSSEVRYKTDRTWETGNYVMELLTADSIGQPVKDVFFFTVADAAGKKVADNALLVFQLDKATYKAGEVVRLKVGSASHDATFIIEIERDHKISKTYVEHFSGNTKEILIPVIGTAHGFSIHCSGVSYNSFIRQTRNIPVVTEAARFEIETLTFKDKLQPGAKETWSFSIKGDETIRKEAEVLASMYDASLDQFKQHAWSFNPVNRPEYYSSYFVTGHQSFGRKYFDIRNRNDRYLVMPHQNYDQFDWFGFTIANNYLIKRGYIDRLYSSGEASEAPSRIIVSNNRKAGKGYVYGRITTSNNEPLSGVTVVIKGTNAGTVTDEKGYYTLEVGKDDVLVYSFIGFATAEAKVGRKNTVDVIMEEDVTQLSEVVVVGYGVQAKRELTGAVAAVVFEEDTTASDVEFAPLNGKMAGVQVSTAPGMAYSLRIRGASSISGNEAPLYVVDGVLVESSRIEQSDIAGMQVLKGNAATSLYGARAANGVIVITTKSGQKKMDEELAKVSARKNFNETAFFFPHLSTDENGNVRFTFTTPEALTRWKLQLLAHTRDLQTATQTLQTVTQKELMVTPNPPRFLRVGDEIIFSAKIANLSSKKLQGKIGLQLKDAITSTNVDDLFNNAASNQVFKIEGRATTEVSWKLKIPSGVEAMQYRIVAKAGNFSDGEQNVLPVLSNRMLVTETVPLYVRSQQTKTFELKKLRAQDSPTLQHHRLTLEITSNPAWYAIQALPYLMEFPHECAEQMFSRYYANALASHIINGNPKIKQVFDTWSSSHQLVSNLEKNQELRSIVIEETPWLRDAQSEAEQKKRLALLFDLKTMSNQLTSVIDRLNEMQLGNGGFPWFSGGRYTSRYITQHIASGYGHLKKLNVTQPGDPEEMIGRAVAYLDGEIKKDYSDLLSSAARIQLKATSSREGERQAQEFLEKNHLDYMQIQYLYMRGFYDDLKPDQETAEAIAYYRKQSAAYWKEQSLYMKGMIALIQYRNNNSRVAKAILQSLRENAVISNELGMYWKENAGGWHWYEAPVETQALLIEAFAEIADDSVSPEARQNTIDELRIWLLKNKQTTQWKTTKATTEAVYALLLQGTDWLPLDNSVEVAVGNKKVKTDAGEEAGTGYFKTSWKEDAITPDMGTVTFTKKDAGIAWGGFYWQYFEDLDRITPGVTPLKLTKKVFVVNDTDRGEILADLDKTTLKVGDRLRIRIEMTADRPMEFLHMKDMRASGLEPMDVLSEYKWRENLGYYQSTRDAATHFFFDHIPKGVYVFEYDLRVSNKGHFSNGITTIQSMYAPEFGSHSEGIRIAIE